MGDGPCDGQALALAARQLSRKMIGPVGEAEIGEKRLGPFFGGPAIHADDVERGGDVLPGSQARKQIEELEDEADPVEPHCPQPLLAETGGGRAADAHRALVRLLHGAHKLKKRRLSAARRTPDQKHLSGFCGERDPPQGRRCELALAIGEDGILDDEAFRGLDHLNTLVGSIV